MRYKVCRKPNCDVVIPYTQHNPYCTQHAYLYKPRHKRDRQSIQTYNQFSRDKEANRFYHTQAWRIISRQIKQHAYFTCQCCDRTYDKPNYLIVDHIVPRRIDKRRQLDRTNLWLLCKRCHYWKTELEKKIYTSQSLIENLDTGKRWTTDKICEWILDKEGKTKSI